MKVALASARFVDRDLAYNFNQIRRFAAKAAEGGAELVCFGEAFLQGFDSLCWDFEKDREMAVSVEDEVFQALCSLTGELGIDILLGFLERDGETIYSSCALLGGGKLIHLYRRISRGWKEYWKTDSHYQEGTAPETFSYGGKTCLIAVCGDLWDMPERFRQGEDVLFWPVYVSYRPEQWANGLQAEYASKAAQACGQVLMINSLCDGGGYGGSCQFCDGRTVEAQPMGQEGLLFVEI